MKIAISAVIFGRTRSIGSRRPRALAEGLAKRGHDVTVFTATVTESPHAAPPKGVKEVLLPEYSQYYAANTAFEVFIRRAVTAIVVSPTTLRVLFLKSPFAARLSKHSDAELKDEFETLNKQRRESVLGALTLLASRQWLKKSKKALKHYQHERPAFDLVFSTYGPIGSLWLGRELFQSWGIKYWVSDLRDPISQPWLLFPVRAVLKHFEYKNLKEADHVIVVSEGIKTGILEPVKNQKFAEKISVITNGFVGGDAATGPAAVERASRTSGPLRIGYMGALYDEKRDLRKLFAIISRINQSSSKTKIEFHYAGDDSVLVARWAEECQISENLVLHGQISYEESLALQDEMDILTAVTWNTTENQGVLSGKFLEYLGREKPIVSLVHGPVGNSEVARMVQELNVGIACEEAHGPAAYDRLESYLLRACDEKRTLGAVAFKPDEEKVAQFEYTNIVNRIEGLLTEIAQ